MDAQGPGAAPGLHEAPAGRAGVPPPHVWHREGQGVSRSRSVGYSHCARHRAERATKRVVNTLRTWDVRVEESYFLGGVEKTGVLAALRAHMFFDDQRVHLDPAQATTPSAHLPAEQG